MATGSKYVYNPISNLLDITDDGKGVENVTQQVTTLQTQVDQLVEFTQSAIPEEDIKQLFQ